MKYALRVAVAACAVLFFSSAWAGETMRGASKQMPDALYADAEALILWSKEAPKKFPMITGFTDGTGGFKVGAGGTGGQLTDPTTKSLYGDSGVDFGVQFGGRVAVGGWVGSDRQWGLEVNGFTMARQKETKDFTNDGGPLALAFYDVPNADEDALAVNSVAFQEAAKAPFVETLSLKTEDRHGLWGLEALVNYNIFRDPTWWLDFRGGFQTLSLNEDFRLAGKYSFKDSFIEFRDRFETRNRFYGAKLAMKVSVKCWDRIIFDAEPMVGVGEMQEEVRINGGYQINDPSTLFPGLGVMGPGGFYALPSNLGVKQQTVFAVVPGLNLKAGYAITKNIAFKVGYVLLYANKVVRPGDQTSRAINPTQQFGQTVVGAAVPIHTFKESNYWAQGISAGFNFKF